MPCLIAVAITLVASFLVTFLVMPSLIRGMKERGLTGIDLNKYHKPKVAESGGIGVIFGFSFGIMAAIFCFSYLKLIELNLGFMLAAFSTIVLVGLIGIVDDIIGWKKGIRKWQHALLPLFAALPLMAVRAGTTEMNIPFIGFVSLGIFYSLLVIPIGVTGASNAFNMLAGLNGIEAGQGIILLGTLASIALLYNQPEALFVAAALIGALAAFLYYNWVPAKSFGGDCLTLMIGATIASVSIIGNMEKVGICLMALFFAELFIKAKHRFQSECFGIPQKDGTLKPDPRGGSITHLVMKGGSFTEKQVVLIILGMQAVISIMVFILFYYRLF